MKTVSDFKKRLKVGVKLHAVNHLTFSGQRDEKNQPIYTNKDLGTREVSIVQSNSFALKTIKSDGTTVDSWCGYPRAKECLFSQDGNAITILEEQTDGKLIPVLTYTFI